MVKEATSNLGKTARIVLALGALLLAIGVVVSCGKKSQCARGKNIFSESELVALYERDGYDEVFIVNSKGEEVAHYVLVEKDDTVSYDLPEDAVEIRVPVDNMIIDSEVYASAIAELGALEKISGMFDAAYVSAPVVKKRIEEGKIKSVGQPSAPDLEKIYSLHPEVMLISYFDGMQTQHIDKLEIPIIKMFDLQESTPLARAEWLRFIGRLIGKSDEADEVYAQVAEKYSTMRQDNGENKDGQKVLTDTMYEGVWYVPAPGSYQATLLEDAGARYFKAEGPEGVTLNLTPEQVLVEGGDADIWIIRHYGDREELKAILSSDPVYKEIKAYGEGNVYFSDTSKSNIYGEFPFHPERLLEDYRKILAGDSVGLRYFEKL